MNLDPHDFADAEPERQRYTVLDMFERNAHAASELAKTIAAQHILGKTDIGIAAVALTYLLSKVMQQVDDLPLRHATLGVICEMLHDVANTQPAEGASYEQVSARMNRKIDNGEL